MRKRERDFLGKRRVPPSAAGRIPGKQKKIQRKRENAQESNRYRQTGKQSYLFMQSEEKYLKIKGFFIFKLNKKIFPHCD